MPTNNGNKSPNREPKKTSLNGQATSTKISQTSPPLPVAINTLPNLKKSNHVRGMKTRAIDIAEININGENYNSAGTMERKQFHRLSWVNMRQAKDEAAVVIDNMLLERQRRQQQQQHQPITPSPQTTRSYISTVSAAGMTINNMGVAGTVSGRTTATSGRISSSGITTISSSNNTLNDIHSDYHSQDVGSRDFSQNQRFNLQHSPQSPHKHHSSIQTLSSPTKSVVNNSYNLANGSTVQLLAGGDDETNQQTKCSVFRGLILCICLNLTYANVVRFPRELDKYGSAYLVPYLILLFLLGLPLMLLEISIGQFLGQGAANTWRASPIFKGACIISRFASWLSTVWISLQAVLALAYVGMYSFNTIPFRECTGRISTTTNNSYGYTVSNNSGEECLLETFLKPFWENPLYFSMLSIGLICVWIVLMICTHNGKILRRCLFLFGLFGFVLLSCLTGWEVHNSLERSCFPELWLFESSLLMESNIWFNALMQVLFSINCGFGILPTLTGKFLYKSDAVRTSVVYLCFNLLINAIAVTLFMVQFDHPAASLTDTMIDELKPLTAIYDRMLTDRPHNEVMAQLMPILLNVLIVVSAVVSIIVAIYTVTRLVPRRPNYVICLIALVASIISLSAPRFIFARILDSRIVGTLVISAMIFELIAVTWIYGAKNIYTDLEFSIGRPIFKGWLWLWCISPAILTGLLVWWCADDDQYDVLANYMPRWAPILFVMSVICIIACVQIFHQVDYNFFGMICEASKSAKEWGPADPLARHAWKQWRSVCQDTGRRDFTLRRRGTRDYTHSIKKGQYSNASKYAGANGVQTTTANHNNWKTSSPGNSSPNYSGSMFGDSAIEEDISVDKFPGVTQHQPSHQQQPQSQLQQQQQYVPYNINLNGSKPLRYSHRNRAAQRLAQTHLSQSHSNVPLNSASSGTITANDKHREVVYVRRYSDDCGKHATRIEITPSNDSITYANIVSTIRNPLARSSGSDGNINNCIKRTSSSTSMTAINMPNAKYQAPLPPHHNTSSEHICWRKFNVNPEEYSTEL